MQGGVAGGGWMGEAGKENSKRVAVLEGPKQRKTGACGMDAKLANGPPSGWLCLSFTCINQRVAFFHKGASYYPTRKTLLASEYSMYWY